MSRWSASTWPLLCGRPARMRVMWTPWTATARRKRSARNFRAVVGQYALEPPAGSAELAGDAAHKPRGLDGAGLSAWADDQVGPGVAGGDVDRAQLPDRPVGAVQAADEEAVDADQLAGPLGLDVPLRLGLARWLVGSAVAGDQREPLGARVEAMPAKTAPHPVGGDDQPAPLAPAQLASDPPRPKAGIGEREGDDPLLNQRRELIGHPRPAPLTRSQHLQPMPVDLDRKST